MIDFTYRRQGLFVQIFPENEQATEEWNREIGPKTDGTGKVLSVEWPLVLSQLQAAGFTVKHATKPRVSDDTLLAELGL